MLHLFVNNEVDDLELDNIKLPSTKINVDSNSDESREEEFDQIKAELQQNYVEKSAVTRGLIFCRTF